MAGKKGRPSKIAALDYLDGDSSHGKKVLKDLGVFGFGVPFIPKHLMQDARECIVTVQSGMPPGMYTKLDSYVLACFGVAWAMHKQAVEEMNRDDFEWIIVNDKGNQSPNPWLKILNEQVRVLVSLGDRLGLDPRSRETLQQPASRTQSKFSGLIGPGLIEHNAS